MDVPIANTKYDTVCGFRGSQVKGKSYNELLHYMTL